MPVTQPLPDGPYTVGVGTPGQDAADLVAFLTQKGTATDAEILAAVAGRVGAWAASTAYVAGQSVVNPSGELVKALVAFTSGTTYSAANWSTPPSATYEPRGGLSNTLPMRWLVKKSRSIKGGTAGRVKLMTLFDSLAQKTTGQLAAPLINVFGPICGAYFTGTSATNSISVNSTTGTVTDNASDFTLWPSGLTSAFAVGATRTYGQTGSAFVGDKIKVYYLNVGGTFKVQVDGVDNQTVVTTTDNSLGVVSITATNASHTVTVVGVSGAPKIVGVGFENTAASGMCFINVSQGGIGVDSPTTQAWTNLRTFLADVLPDVITWEAKESAATLTSSFDSFCTAVTSSAPNCDVVLIQSPPQSTNDSDNVAQNVIYRAKAVQYGFLTFDSYTPFKDYATLTAMGMQGDGTHVSADADAFRTALLIRDIGLYQIAEAYGTDVKSTNVNVLSTMKVGKTPTAPVLEVNADLSTDLDVTAKIKRSLAVKDVTGVTTLFAIDARNGTSTPSQLPDWIQVGTGKAGFSSNNASSILVRQVNGGNMNKLGSLIGAGFILGTGTQTIAAGGGTVAIDASAVGRHRVLLNGNVTATTITNPVTDGHPLTIDYVQDATGGRTYVWPTNARFAGGVAPSDTTLSTLTRVTFIWDNIASRWTEQARAVAVPVT